MHSPLVNARRVLEIIHRNARTGRHAPLRAAVQLQFEDVEWSNIDFRTGMDQAIFNGWAHETGLSIGLTRGGREQIGRG